MIDKSGLLGDLKNFAKNFKMPANSDIWIFNPSYLLKTKILFSSSQ